MKQFVTSDEAEVVEKQITKPCSDCPWARKSIKGWLGNMKAEEWIRAAHAETIIDCHALKHEDESHPQCAGSSIYRANVSKMCRSPEVLTLKPDREACFSSPSEFTEHHDLSKGDD